MRRTRTDWAFLAAALAALLAGSAVRFAGVSWGAPYNLHIDEVQSLHGPIRLEWNWLKEGWPRPFNVSHGALSSYVFIRVKNALWGGEHARYWAARTSSQEAFIRAAYSHDRGAPHTYYWPDVTRVMRGISALMMSLAMALAGLIAHRLWGRSAALIAVLAAGGLPGFVQHAHFATGEGYLSLGVAMLLHACVRIADKNLWRDYAYAAAGLEVMTNAKITSAPFLAFIPLATWQFHRAVRKESVVRAALATADAGRMWAALGVWFVGWFYLNQGAARNLEWYFSASTYGSVSALANTYRRGGPLSDWALWYTDRGRFYFATQPMVDACGVAFTVMAWAGWVWMAALEKGPRRWPALFVVAGLAPLWSTPLAPVRYLIPSLVPLSLGVGRLGQLGLGALAGVRAAPRAFYRDWRWHARAAAAVGVLLALGSGWALAVGMSHMHMQTENRVAAAHWLYQHASSTDRVVVGDHPMYRPPILDVWGLGHEAGTPTLAFDYLWSGRDEPNLQNARFVCVDEWELRMTEVPQYRRRFPGRVRWLSAILARGAPPGYHLAARFANRPNVFGWQRDESHADVFSFAFDHLPITIYERDR